MQQGFFCIQEESTFSSLVVAIFVLGVAISASTSIGLRTYRRASRKARIRYRNAHLFLQIFGLVGMLMMIGPVVYGAKSFLDAKETSKATELIATSEEGSKAGAVFKQY